MNPMPTAKYIGQTIIVCAALVSASVAQTNQAQKAHADAKSVQKRTSFPDGVRLFEKNTHHYFLVANPVTLAEARNHSEKAGGHLVTINDENEKKSVTTIICQAMKNRERKLPGWIWVGASKEDGRWVWDDGTKFPLGFLQVKTLGGQKNKLTTTPLNLNCLVLRTDVPS